MKNDYDYEIDLEEIEARLYSQIYHSTETTDYTAPTADLLAEPAVKSNRYFDYVITNDMQSGRPPVTNLRYQNDTMPLHVFQKRQKRKRKQKANRMKHGKRANMNVDVLSEQVNAISVVNSNETIHNSAQESNSTPNVGSQPATSNVVQICDSDEDACVEVVEDTCLVVLSSDGEEDTAVTQDKTHEVENKADSDCEYDDDVVFVEDKASASVIDVEDDSQSVPTRPVFACEDINDLVLTATGDALVVQNEPTREQPPSPTSSTSTTNDFLDTTIETTHRNFNFSLHGSDFTTKPTKPPHISDIYDSESSTSEASTPLKTVIFSEIPFDAPSEDIFKGANLENFRSFITPKRPVTDPSKAVKRTTNASKVALGDDSGDSESSSESDYEVVGGKEGGVLPDLSPMVSCDDLVKTKASGIVRNVDEVAEKAVKTVENTDKNVDVIAIASTSAIDAQMTVLNATEGNEVQTPTNLQTDGRTRANKRTANSGPRVPFKKRTMNTNAPSIDVTETSQVIDEPEYVNSSSSTTSEYNWKLLDDVSCDIELGNIETTPTVTSEKFQPTDGFPERHSFESYWRDDKEKFYKESWGQENFDVSEVQQTMSDDPSLWKIAESDKVLLIGWRSRGVRCNRCREFGHKAVKCTKMYSPVKCILCGEADHLETRCPKKVCLTCGERCQVSTPFCQKCARTVRNNPCKVCRQYGHLSDRCPDLWRRYFLTTTDGPPIPPSENNQLKRKTQRSCSACAQMGHFEYECNYFNKPYGAVNPIVHNYDDVYEHGEPFVPPEEESERGGFRNDESGPQIAGNSSNFLPQTHQVTMNGQNMIVVNPVCWNQGSFSGAPNFGQYQVINSSNFQGPSGVLNGNPIQFPDGSSDEIPNIQMDNIPKDSHALRALLVDALRYINSVKFTPGYFAARMTKIKQLESNSLGVSSEESFYMLKSEYRKLNFMLFAKFKINDGFTFVRNLKMWSRRLEKASIKKSNLPNSKLRKIKAALSYLFDDNRKSVDYKKLILKAEEQLRPRPVENPKRNAGLPKMYKRFIQICQDDPELGNKYYQLHHLFQNRLAGNGDLKFLKLEKFYGQFIHESRMRKLRNSMTLDSEKV